MRLTDLFYSRGDESGTDQISRRFAEGSNAVETFKCAGVSVQPYMSILQCVAPRVHMDPQNVLECENCIYHFSFNLL